MIPEFSFRLVNRAIVSALRYDPGTRKKLASMDGKLIRLCIEWTESKTQTVDIAFENESMAFSPRQSKQDHTPDTAIPDVTLKGTFPALIQLATDNDGAIQKSSVTITGNIHLLNTLRSCLKDLDIDWEEAVTGMFGDVAGHQMAGFLKSKMTFAKNTAQSFPAYLGDFVTEELQSCPSKTELDTFYSDVDDTVSDFQRLQARVAKLANTILDTSN